ncbi:MAG: acyl-CoA thioesterase [Ignavibacteriales bacterium]|nr:acyl-CoA thioesterase [Ignavibacteriales bacterium]
MIFSETLIRVRYADTDQMKFAYYGKYFEYFEQGRSDLLRQIGLPYPEIEKRGIILPVIEAHANYLKSARYDDELVVKTIFKELPQARLRIEYEVVNNETKELLATGHTVHSFLLATTNKPTRAPEFFIQAIHNYLQQ